MTSSPRFTSKLTSSRTVRRVAPSRTRFTTFWTRTATLSASGSLVIAAIVPT